MTRSAARGRWAAEPLLTVATPAGCGSGGGPGPARQIKDEVPAFLTANTWRWPGASYDHPMQPRAASFRTEPGVRVASFAELDIRTLHDLLKLRCDVFVVEQRCPYPDIDGRDTEPNTRHLWVNAEGSGGPVAYLRILRDPDGAARIGRVCTAAEARGSGLAGRLMVAALELVGPAGECVLDAQSYLVGFYTGLGFVVSGPEYVEDGIPHTPMRLVRPGRPDPAVRAGRR